MRIALFHTTLPEKGRKLGGVEIAVHRLANQLALNKEDEVTVLSLTPCPDDAKYTHKHLFSDRSALKDSQLLRLFGLPFLMNFVDWSSYDVVHFHGDDWFLLRRPFSSVRTLHGSALFEARSATSLKRKIAQYCVFPLEYLSARLATIPLAVGPKTAVVYNIDKLANNGVNIELFRPGDKADHPQILYIGTWEGRKRGNFIFKQFVEHVFPQLPTAELIMVSDHAPEHPNVKRVHFPDDETLAELYRSAWVFAYPSIYEGFGIPYIEAMASGTAVVCSPNDGASYVLDNGKYGAVVNDGDFAHSLIDLLQNKSRRENMVEAGLRRAHSFSWEAVARQHKDIYVQSLLKRGDRTLLTDTGEEIHEY